MSPQGFVVDIVINNEIAKQDIGTSTIGKVGHTRFGYAGVGKHNHLNAEQVNAESPNFAHIGAVDKVPDHLLRAEKWQ